MMKLVIKKTFSIFLLCSLPLFCFSQNQLAKANQLYDNLAFADAIPEYEKCIKQHPGNAEAIVQLAHCYRLVNNSKEAERWYARAVELTDVSTDCLKYYAQSLLINGDYTTAGDWIVRYKQIVGADEEADKIIESIKHLSALYQDSTFFTIEKLSINSNRSDFSPVVYGDGLVFASARNRRIEMVQRTHQWTGFPFYSLYFANGRDKEFGEPKIFAGSIMTKFNDGPVSFNKAGDELYVTRNNIEEGKVKTSDNGIVKLKIFHYKKSELKWIDETSFPFNSDQYNCAYPCLSADGSKMYFSSDMPGGFGSLDLYVSTKTGGTWGKPVNLGPSVNTAGSEGFAFIDEADGLYFSSNGLGGLGGYDIFHSDKSILDYNEPANLGYPINSSADDFGWVQNELGTSGYFTSNREDKNENDDIYYFKRNSPLLNVLVYDSKTKTPMEAASVQVFESGILKKVVFTSPKGTISMFLIPGREYQLIASNEKYSTDSAEIIVENGRDETRNLTIALKKIPLLINVKGMVYLNSDNSQISNSEVSLVNMTTGEITKAISAADGSYQFNFISPDSRFQLVAKKKNCISTPVEINTSRFEENQNLTYDLALNCINDIVKLDNIYYDFNKFVIRKDAAKVLDRLAIFLKANDGMNIELRSHTDCRGSDNYNLVLSERRAKAAVAYLINRGISPKLLTAKGYGETMLIYQCSCEGNSESKCTPEQDQMNRRTEFKILNFDQAREKGKGLEVLK